MRDSLLTRYQDIGHGRITVHLQESILDAGCRWSFLCGLDCLLDVSHRPAVVGVENQPIQDGQSVLMPAARSTQITSIRLSGRMSTM